MFSLLKSEFKKTTKEIEALTSQMEDKHWI